MDGFTVDRINKSVHLSVCPETQLCPVTQPIVTVETQGYTKFKSGAKIVQQGFHYLEIDRAWTGKFERESLTPVTDDIKCEQTQD